MVILYKIAVDSGDTFATPNHDHLIEHLLMIFSKPTKYGAGIELYGDYQDLNSLRQTILDLSDSPALNDGADEFVLGLAYEVRHAYEGARGTTSVSLPGMPPTTFSFQDCMALGEHLKTGHI